jgi:DNA transposition AAA+ family ATPase
MLNETQKQHIVTAAAAYITDKGISNKAFSDLAGINPSYLSHMLNGKWNEVPAGNKLVSLDNKYFAAIAKACGYAPTAQAWGHLETINYQYMVQTFTECRGHRMPVCIDGGTGAGKTYTAERYKQLCPQETYLVRCSGDLTSKSFMVELAESLNLRVTGATSEIRKACVNRLKRDSQPLLIIDEGENLKDGAWDSIKTMMDALKGHCGMVVIGANEFEHTLRAKSDRMRRSFPQIYRRIKEGGIKKLVPMEMVDVTDICNTVGIADRKVQQLLFDHYRNIGELSGAIQSLLREAGADAITHQLAKRILDL